MEIIRTGAAPDRRTSLIIAIEAGRPWSLRTDRRSI